MDVSVFLPSFQIAIVRCACQVPLVGCTTAPWWSTFDVHVNCLLRSAQFGMF